jgi:hypothetical protein
VVEGKIFILEDFQGWKKERCPLKATGFQLEWRNAFGDVLYNMVTGFNDIFTFQKF